MIGDDFIFDNVRLSSYGMKMYTPDETQVFPQREIDKGNLSAVRSIPNHYSTHYSDVLVFNFFILKDCENANYGTQRDMILSSAEINDLRTWLESPKLPCELFLESENNKIELFDDDVSGEKAGTYYYGIFTGVNPYILNGDCYGLNLTFTCNAPYGFSYPVSKKATISGGQSAYSISFDNKSAEVNEYLRPKIIITSTNGFSGTEKIEIKNTTDNNKKMGLEFSENLANKKKVIIDCAKKIVKDEEDNVISLYDIGLAVGNQTQSDIFSVIYWLRLVHGANTININVSTSGNLTDIEISARYIIKAGGF